MSYSAMNTWPSGSGTTIGSAPSQPRSSPPKVSRQPLSHPVPAAGEWGHRSSICSGSMFEPYAAYRPPSCSPICGGAYRAPGPSGTMVGVTNARAESGTATRILVLGGGPAGYEAALVAAQLG